MQKGFILQLLLICSIFSLVCAFWSGYYIMPGMMFSQSNLSMSELSGWPRDKWNAEFINRGLVTALFFELTLVPIMFLTFRHNYKISIGDKRLVRLLKIIAGGIFMGIFIPILPSILLPYFAFWALIPYTALFGGISMLVILVGSSILPALRI